MTLNLEALLVTLVFATFSCVVGLRLHHQRPSLPLGMACGLGIALWLVGVLAIAMPFGWSFGLGLVMGLVVVGIVISIPAQTPPPPHPPYPPLEIAFFAVVMMGVCLPVLILPVPLDTDAQGFGYLALMARMSGELTRLAPFQPDIHYLYAPALSVLSAFFSEAFGSGMHATLFGIAAVLVTLFTMMVYDFAHAVLGRGYARACAVALWIGTGLLTTYMDSHFTTLLGLVFGILLLFATHHAFVTRQRGWWVVGGVSLGALVLAHPDTTIIMGMGFGLWLLVHLTSVPWHVGVGTVLAIPSVALVLILPWLISVAPLLGGHIASPFERDPNYWRMVISYPPELLYHGGLIVLFSAFGVWVAFRRGWRVGVLGIGWLVLTLDFASFGILETLLPWLVAPITRYDYPFSIAWHAPIIPYALLGGMGLWALWEASLARWLRPTWATRLAWSILTVGAVSVLLVGIFNRELLALSKGRITFFGAFASHADVQAMVWLREHTPPNALILNFPGPQEGDWVPVIAERESIYYRPQPFFDRGDTDPLADTPEQVALRAFWHDPANTSNAQLLQRYGIDYVIVPQVVGNPATFADMVRWRAPFTKLIEAQSAITDAACLEEVFNRDGATVYAVMCR